MSELLDRVHVPTPNTDPLPDGPFFAESFSDAEKDAWWELYDKDFAEINRTNPCRQSFYKDEFIAALDNPATAKFAYAQGGEVTALCILGSDFDSFPWLSKEFYQGRYGEDFDSGNVFYFISLLTKEEYRRQNHASEVIDFMTKLLKIGDKPIVVTFDCCEENSKYLPQMIEAVVGATGEAEIQFDEIGKQTYYAGKLSLGNSQAATSTLQ